MKKKIAIVLAFVLAVGLLVMGVTSGNKSYAKAAQLSIEIPSGVKKENEFKVKVVLDSDVNLYSLDAYLLYDADLLEFVPDSEYVTGSAGVLELKDSFAKETREAEYELTFRALEVGIGEIAFSDVYLVDYADMDYMEVFSNAKSFDIGVNKKVTNDARLAELIIAPGALATEFDSDCFEYDVHVGLDVRQVAISAVAFDEESVIETMMPETLAVGENTITVTVTAQSGTQEIYTIHVYREEIEEELNSETEENMELQNETQFDMDYDEQSQTEETTQATTQAKENVQSENMTEEAIQEEMTSEAENEESVAE